MEHVGNKRTCYISWDEYFMGVALISAERSKDPVTQVGACIVNQEKRIVGVGYNGMPNGCSDDEMPWGKGYEDPLHNKKLFVCHAEMNAIVNKVSADIAGCTIYVTLFPCNDCAKIIIQSRLKDVVYYDDKNLHKSEAKASVYMFRKAGINVRQYNPTGIGRLKSKL
ncbi:deoxycytidylate deaminase-like [Ostrea edulis]|uniref:deoxycytidylate deaminase-like n=1 Tax=Ostrea edulis TaxID=37623 RepID=UPI0024AF2FEB|nr:deoxycytidylate deaminase-like [Ostrea edulis]XP_048774474.2 deoxycytidylate deaminase-like [Ostrea edulis]